MHPEQLSQLTLVVLWIVIPVSYAEYSYAVYVLKQNGSQWGSVLECRATGASFGSQLSMGNEITGCGKFTDPVHACSKVRPPIPNFYNNSSEISELSEQDMILFDDDSENYTNQFCMAYFGLIKRGNCTFATKAVKAEVAGYRAAIIVNTQGQPLVTMSGDDDVQIPVLMVSHTCGQAIFDRFPYEKGYVVLIRSFYSYDLLKYLIPFVVVVGFCFLIMLGAMVIKFVRDRRRLARRRLSRRNLRKLPTKKYKKVGGEEPEICPICLDDFDDGDKLRVLPCKHMYHTKCVDPWLTKNRKVCPVCKRKVLPNSGDSTDSDEEHQTNTPAQAPGLTQGTPLLGSVEDNGPFTVGNSMFYAQYQNPTPPGLSDERKMEHGGSAPFLDEEDTPGPSSSASENSSRKSSRRRPKPRIIVPGFIANNERGVVPPPSDSTIVGVENPGYDSSQDESRVARPEDLVDVSAFKQIKPKRKRHPATHNVKVGDQAALLAEERLTLESDDDENLRPPGPRSERPEPRPPKISKKRKNRIGNRQKSMDSQQKSIAASAPANLPSEVSSSVVTDNDIIDGRGRDESLQLEDDEDPRGDRLAQETGRTGKEEGEPYESYIV